MRRKAEMRQISLANVLLRAIQTKISTKKRCTAILTALLLTNRIYVMTAREMWLLFRKKNSIDTDSYEVWAFGDEPDELAQLVLEGKKTATASVYDLYGYDSEPLPKAGEYSVIIDSQDRAVCVIRDTEVTIVPFKDVDEDQAWREGEGDRSLEYWRSVHRECFSKWLEDAGMTFTENTRIVLEKFDVVFKP